MRSRRIRGILDLSNGPAWPSRPEGRARAIRFESWDLSHPPVYFATEKKALDWIEKRGWILRSKCWSYCPDEPEARITVYASEDDMNYGDIFEGHLIRPVAAFKALTRGLAIARHTSENRGILNTVKLVRRLPSP